MRHTLSLFYWSLLALLTLACTTNSTTSDVATSDGTLADAAETATSAPLPYDLTKPARRYDLPKDLREVSGISYYKPDQLASIQDELGVVFIYDLKQQRVVAEHIFGPAADYEDVAWVNGEFFVLRSDGELYRFKPGAAIKTLNGTSQTRHIKIGLPGKNDVEGLGYDPKLNALLLATKDAERKGTDKPIYFYGLKGAALYQGPVLKQDALRQFDPTITDEVKPSGIAVHPQTGDYYVLASGGSRLLVLRSSGKLLSAVALDKEQFRQPEGITFAPDGTLFIASEGGKKGTGYVLAFTPATTP